MKPILRWAIPLAVATVLAACGGGSGPTTELPSLQNARAALADCDTPGLASGNYQLVGDQCVASSTLLGRPVAQAAAAAASITADQFFNWAESTFGIFFPASGKSSGTRDTLVFRYYPGTDVYLAVTTDAAPSVYAYGQLTGFAVRRLAALADFTCAVSPTSCTGSSTTAGGTTGSSSTSTTTTPTTSTGSTTTTGTTTASTPTTTTSTSPSGTTASGTSSTAGVQCSYSYNAYNASASVKMNSTASWSCTGTQRMLSGNGVPDHAVGSFPNANNPSAIKALTVNAAMPIAPALASSTTTGVHVVGYAFNSVKMDPATAATCAVSGSTVTCTADGNTGTWNIEAMGQTYMNLGLDSNNAHVQPDGSYHYHGMPEGFVSRLGKGTAMTLVGFALDGFPIYARYGYSTATSATSAIKVVTSSYRLKTTPSSGRPSTTTYPMGLFTQDYEYVAGSGDLDECNGRFGVTPEFPSGIYHYVITDTWPYIGRCLKGTPTTAPH